MGMHWGTSGKALGDTHGANVLTPHGLHLWAMGTGPKGETWTLYPKEKEEGNRENICKSAVAVTNPYSKNMGLNGNG